MKPNTIVHMDRRTRGGHQVWRLWWRDPATGRQRSREQRGWTRAEAARERAALEMRLGPTGPSIPWPEFAARCLAEHGRRCKPSSLRVLASVLRRYEAVMAPARLGDVTAESVRKYLEKDLGAGLTVPRIGQMKPLRPAGASAMPAGGESKQLLPIRVLERPRAATVNKHVVRLRAAFTWAIDEGGLADAWSNPCVKVRRRKEVHLQSPVLERRNHLDRLIAALAREGVRWEIAGRPGAECGLRVDEIGHLAWRSVDIYTREVVVQPELDGWTPKGLGGQLAMTAGLADALVRRINEAYPRGICPPGEDRVVGGACPAGFVRAFRERLKRACVQAGLTKLAPHGLRRTFATIIANAGLEAAQLQVVMRHADIKTTLRYYAKIKARRAADEARRLVEEAL